MPRTGHGKKTMGNATLSRVRMASFGISTVSDCVGGGKKEKGKGKQLSDPRSRDTDKSSRVGQKSLLVFFLPWCF